MYVDIYIYIIYICIYICIYIYNVFVLSICGVEVCLLDLIKLCFYMQCFNMLLNSSHTRPHSCLRSVFTVRDPAPPWSLGACPFNTLSELIMLRSPVPCRWRLDVGLTNGNVVVVLLQLHGAPCSRYARQCYKNEVLLH